MADGPRLELSSGGGRLRVELADDSAPSAGLPLNSRIRAIGLCQSRVTNGIRRKGSGDIIRAEGRELLVLQAPPDELGNWLVQTPGCNLS